MQRKLNLRSNGCKECGFLKMSISKVIKKMKVFWINSQNWSVSGRGEISGGLQSGSCAQAAAASSPRAAERGDHQQIPGPGRRRSESDPGSLAFEQAPPVWMQRLERCAWRSPFYNIPDGFPQSSSGPSALGQPVPSLDISAISVKFGRLCVF